ncbi:hypothetical protein GCM10027416_05380 [Okibacterium endophyticum]
MPGPERPAGRRHPLVGVLAGVLVVESLAMLVLAVVVIVDTLTLDATASAMPTALALTVLVLLGTVWIVAVTIGMVRVAPWSKGGALYWQLIQLAIALGAFQGVFAQPAIGWALVVPSVIALVLLFTRPVTRALARQTPYG